ncbi:coiled-coil domain-containing protein 12 [Aethina tumida]|uniref:coiled-coil domain-containing protein 12 n=1 Tax=Aethina tumida TaxID=116153 RepID=UPI0021473151|nr:coiled-coil domain-containing protein 12 [Aethina tumida]
MAEDKIGNMEEQALKRREKLLQLKRKREGKTDEPNAEQKATDEKLPKPKFRSYKPADESLEEHVLPSTKPGDVGAQVKDQLESAKSETVIDQLDLSTLAPRKPDWDLKRDVAKKLEKLERQTQKAIAELIRDRFKQGHEDLAAVVTIGADAGGNEP